MGKIWGNREKMGEIGGKEGRQNIKRGRRFSGGGRKRGALKCTGGAPIWSGICPPPFQNPGYAPGRDPCKVCRDIFWTHFPYSTKRSDKSTMQIASACVF